MKSNHLIIFSLFCLFTLFTPNSGFASASAPPKKIPVEFWNEFTWNGEIPVRYWYFNCIPKSKDSIIYSYERVEENKKKAINRETNYYGKTDTYLYNALDQLIGNFNGKTVGILGSVNPWYEAIVLAYGGRPISIDYNPIISEHPDIKTLTIDEYNENPIQFDYLFSISSFEHDGLGRYGDPINPTGDLEAMKKAKSMLSPDGYLFLAVPVGVDTLVWNAHRVYGSKRLPLLFNDWEVVDSYGFSELDLHRKEIKGNHQPVWVLSSK